MKKLNVILYIFFLIVLSSVTFAALSTTPTPVVVYDFAQTSGHLLNAIDNSDNASTEESITSRTATGINGNAWYFNADNTNSVNLTQTLMDDMTSGAMICWIKPITLYDSIIFGGGGSPGHFYTKIEADKKPLLRITTSVNEYATVDAGVLIGEGGWSMIGWTWDGTLMHAYQNATKIGSAAATGTLRMEGLIAFGKLLPDGKRYFNGTLDECYFWNVNLSAGNFSDLWNNGDGGFYPFIALPGNPDAPVIAPPSPADNAHNNTNSSLNVSHSSSLNDVQYYLYFSSSSTLTEEHLQLYNVTRTGSEYCNFTTNISDGTYYWKWRVQNVSNGLFSSNTTQRTFILDTVSPTITRLTNNNWKTDNTTILSSYIQNLTLNISFYDETDLYQTIVNVTNSTGDSVFNYSDTTITGTTDNISEVINIGGWSIGDYTIKLQAADSHTAISIRDYSVVKGINYLRYKTDEGNVIKITSDTLPMTFSTNKFKDRYDFKFNYLFQKATYKFRIESYNKIDYIEDSNYKAHFVIMGSNGGNWIDFENPNLNKKDYTISKIDDYNFEVEINANGLKSFTFSSLGGLNQVEKHYKIQLGAVIDIWSFDDDTGAGLNVTATIGSQFNHTKANASPATLVNITKDITSVTLNATGYGTEEKTISITSKYHNFSLNMTAISATKLYFYDEKSEALITAETFSVYLETTGFSQTYSSITDNPHTITNLTSGLYKLKASSTNYPERQYLDLNVSNITTTNLNIYLINSTLGSEITFNIVSADGLAPLENVRTVFTKIIAGTKTIIAEEESDYAGQVVLTLDEDTEYTINFSKANYEDKEISLEPTDSEYLIQMVSTIGAYNRSVHEGIRYSFSPSNTILNNDTKYNFTFTLNSTVWDITNCNLTLKNESDILDTTTSYTSTGCFLRIELDTASMTKIISEAIYELNNQEFTVSQQYSVIYTYEGDFSLKNFLDDLTDFGMAGFDDFGRMILAFIVIFVILAMASMKISFENKEVPIFMFWALVGFFSYIKWFYMDFLLPILGLRKWFIFYLISLICGGFVINKLRK